MKFFKFKYLYDLDEENPSYHVENEELYSKTIEQKLQDIQEKRFLYLLYIKF